MDVLIFSLCLLVFFLGLALFSNQVRTQQDIPFELKPNCLLTRWPLLFITGPRSIFYFRSYWNGYTSFLAEHGYEVFTLHLPWSNPQLRREKFCCFIKQQQQAQRNFHLVLDSSTRQEFEDLFRQEKSSAIISITEVLEPDARGKTPQPLIAFPIPLDEVHTLPTKRSPLLLKWAFRIHQLLVRNQSLPSLSALGALPETALLNSHKLLERAQTLAEMDLREDPPHGNPLLKS